MEVSAKRNYMILLLCGVGLGSFAMPQVSQAAPFVFPGFSAPAKKKDTKKPKKTSESQEAFGPPDIAPIARSEADIGVGVHREQEGVDHPYVTELALNGAFSINRKENSSAPDRPTDDRSSQLGVEVSMFFRSLQVGGGVEYSYGSQSTPGPTTDGEAVPTSKFRTETGRYSVGPIIKYNFKNIDRSLLVPFVILGVAYTESVTSGTGITTSGRRGTAARLGTGLNMFLASHVAFAPRLEYVTTQTTGRGNESGAEKNTGLRVSLQLSVFI